MFRYNAYFGIHTVHYMDLIGQTGGAPLPMNTIILAAVKTMLARTLAPTRGGEQPLNPWTQGLFNKLDNLKFLAFIDTDGYPLIIPVIQAQAGRPAQAGLFDRRLHRGTGRHPRGQPGGGARHGLDHGRCAGARRI